MESNKHLNCKVNRLHKNNKGMEPIILMDAVFLVLICVLIFNIRMIFTLI